MEQATSSNEPVEITEVIPTTDSSEAEKKECEANLTFMIKKHLAEIYLRLDKLEAKIEKDILRATEKMETLDQTKLSAQEFREFIDSLNETLMEALPATVATLEGSALETSLKSEKVQGETVTNEKVGPQQAQVKEAAVDSLHPTDLDSETDQRTLMLACADQVPVKGEESTTSIGDIEVPSGTTLNKDIVAEGALRIGDNCRIHGKLEASKDIVVGADTIISGDMISGGNVLVGPRSLITGSVEASGTFEIEENAVVEGGRTQTPLS